MLTLMDFHADWCGPCVAMEPVLAKLMPEYQGKIELKKVNVDEDQANAMKYGVMSIPTMILVKDGQEIDRKIGMLPEPILKQWLDGHLK